MGVLAAEGHGNMTIRLCCELIKKIEDEAKETGYSAEGIVQKIVAEHYGMDSIKNAIEYMNDHRFEEVC